MPTLELLRADHAAAVLEFESANRAYFAESISDRGDEYFEQFAAHHQAMLNDQDAGVAAYYVLVDDDGSVLGRFNLRFVDDGAADLGYRVAQRAAGRGVATAWSRELCDLSAAEHGRPTVRAVVSTRNVASQRVLLKLGFTAIGPADPGQVGGKPGTRYERVAPDS